MSQSILTRRHVLGGLAAGLALPAFALFGRSVRAAEFGVIADTEADQSGALQAALDAARTHGVTLELPAGRIVAGDLSAGTGLRLVGQPGRTVLAAPGPRVLRIEDAEGVVIEDMGLEAGDGDASGVVEIGRSEGVVLRSCRLRGGPRNGVAIHDAAARIVDCDFSGHPNAAIHTMDGRGLFVRGNTIARCGNAGVQIWRSASGPDGSIVSGNRISAIDWVGGGNGQNGNGVNVYRADGVIVADNHIADCAFTAVRVNTARNTQVRGNTCLNSGEVAIFSEFGFSGSVIADNIVDGAATGIDITNLDTGGRVATCTGNIVRNIFPRSAVNPDTRPVGIYAEAETVVANNVVETVPGVGIALGYGPFLRDVTASGNVVSDVDIGIAVSVVDDARVGRALVSGNVIAARQHAIAGLEWERVVSDDLARDAAKFPKVTVAGNAG